MGAPAARGPSGAAPAAPAFTDSATPASCPAGPLAVDQDLSGNMCTTCIHAPPTYINILSNAQLLAPGPATSSAAPARAGGSRAEK